MGLALRTGRCRRGIARAAAVVLAMFLALNTLEARVRVYRADYQGWTNCVWMDNGAVEVVIVPQVGRIMQFRWKGEKGPFWEQETLSRSGGVSDPGAKDWVNWGGDKTWPSPQSDWGKWTARGWPPPVGFDAMPAEVRVRGRVVEIIHAVDPHYGIRARRWVELGSRESWMEVTTLYEKVSGPEMEVGIWVITQLEHPDEVYVPVEGKSRLPGGYVLQSEHVPPSLRRESGGWVMGRDAGRAYKIGVDGEVMVWMRGGMGLKVSSKREGGVGVKYPDGGSSVEVYTNPDPLRYVELEVLGPLKRMKVGSELRQKSRYRLFRGVGDGGWEAIKRVRD